jgi:hypothetical protein
MNPSLVLAVGYFAYPINWAHVHILPPNLDRSSLIVFDRSIARKAQATAVLHHFKCFRLENSPQLMQGNKLELSLKVLDIYSFV